MSLVYGPARMSTMDYVEIPSYATRLRSAESHDTRPAPKIVTSLPRPEPSPVSASPATSQPMSPANRGQLVLSTGPRPPSCVGAWLEKSQTSIPLCCSAHLSCHHLSETWPYRSRLSRTGLSCLQSWQGVHLRVEAWCDECRYSSRN